MNKKKWIIGIGIGAVLLVGGGYGLTQYQTYAKAEEEQPTFDKQQDQLAKQVVSYKKQAASFYLTAKKERLAKEVTTEQVAALESQLHQLEGKEMRAAIAEKLNIAMVDTAYASKMIDLRDQVNGLLDKNGALAEKADVSAVEKQSMELKEAKPVFYAEQNKIIQQAKQQQAQIKKANQSVDALFTDTSRKTIKSNVTRAQFQTALTEKNKVKQAKAKQALIQDLNRVENYLTAQEKQAAEQKAQAETQSKEKANTPQTNNPSSPTKSSSSSASHGGSSTSGYSSSNKSSDSSATPKSSYIPPRSSGKGNTSTSSRKPSTGTSGTEKSNDAGKGTNDTNSSANKDSYDTSDEGINDTTENQNGGTDISWGWN